MPTLHATTFHYNTSTSELETILREHFNTPVTLNLEDMSIQSPAPLSFSPTLTPRAQQAAGVILVQEAPPAATDESKIKEYMDILTRTIRASSGCPLGTAIRLVTETKEGHSSRFTVFASAIGSIVDAAAPLGMAVFVKVIS